MSTAHVFDAAIEEAAALTDTTPTNSSFLKRLLVGLARIPSSSQAPSTEAARPALPLPSFERLAESQTEHACVIDSAAPIPSTVLYLAYGSNLCYETFQGRRGIRPLSAVNVVVPELELVFDLPGLPYIEPCFANSAQRDFQRASAPDQEARHDFEKRKEFASLLSPCQKSIALIGVVYEVTALDYTRIIATEGPAYTDVVVNCNALPTPASTSIPTANSSVTSFKAHTLLAPVSNLRPSQSQKPAQASLRYLTLCRNGAAEHDLPRFWQSYLNQLEHYQITSLRQKIGRAVFLAVCGPWLVCILGLRRVIGDRNGGASTLIKGLTAISFNAVWMSYDYGFKTLFGNGERTER